MSNIATKLTYLNGTKQAIKQAINEDFEVIDNNTTFREYADEISSNNAKYKDLIPKETKNATNTLDISNSSGLDKALVTQYGNSYQEGEPTPDTPQEIVNISGKSTLKDVGKNLFDKDNANIFRGYVNNNSVLANSDTATTIYTLCKPNTTYTVQKSASGTNNRFCVFTTASVPTAGNSVLNYVGTRQGADDNTDYTITTPAEANYLCVFIGVSSTTPTASEIFASIQIEENTTATPYEAYKEKSFDLDLKSKNLFDKDNVNILNASLGYGQDNYAKLSSSVNAKTLYIPIKSNTTYTISKISSQRFVIGVINETPAIGKFCNNVVYTVIGSTSLTITSGTNDTYLCVYYYLANYDTLTEQQILDSIQIEENSTATEYEPYYDINLCKIDTYKDRIYPLNGKWYLDKKSGKVTITGNDITAINTGQTNTTRAKTNNNFVNTNEEGIGYSNYFQIISNWGVDTIGLYYSKTNGDVWFRANKTLIGTTLESVQTWVNSNNVILYYALATPTTEEITENNYPTLYNQLNNIKLFEGVNHITMTNESGLDVEFDIEYYKDWKLD